MNCQANLREREIAFFKSIWHTAIPCETTTLQLIKQAAFIGKATFLKTAELLDCYRKM